MIGTEIGEGKLFKQLKRLSLRYIRVTRIRHFRQMHFSVKHLRLPVMALAMITSLIMTAQERKLPSPSFSGGMPMNEVVAKRHSIREFDRSREIADSTLGQLLWLTAGVNRPDAAPGRFGVAANRSNPTALNRQEIRLYVFDKDGVWEYQPASHSLSLAKEGDHRKLIAGAEAFTQDFVLDAPVSVVFVADMAGLPEGEQTTAMALVDAGIACENLNLACVSEGLATVPRATMDSAAIATLLGLTARQLPVMNNPIGYER